MNDLREFKAKKEGRVTPKVLVENLLQAVDKGEVECIVFVARCKEGEIRTGWSEIYHTEAVGLLELGKLEVISDMHD